MRNSITENGMGKNALRYLQNLRYNSLNGVESLPDGELEIEGGEGFIVYR